MLEAYSRPSSQRHREKLRAKFIKWCSRMYVDIHPWIKACEQQGQTAYSGIFHYARLFLRYGAHPLLLGNEYPDWCIDRVHCLPAKIEQAVEPVTLVRTVEKLIPWDTYMSLGLDQCAPCIADLDEGDADFNLCTLVHDWFAFEEDFGPKNKEIAQKVCLNRLFNRLSVYAPAHICSEVTHGAIAEADIPEWSTYSREYVAIFSNDRKGKNVERSVEVSKRLAKAYELTPLAIGTEHTEKADILRRTIIFVNLSEREGFSLTPYEAALYGVPYMLLSDIPAHVGFKRFCEQTRMHTNIILLSKEQSNIVEPFGPMPEINWLIDRWPTKQFCSQLLPWNAFAPYLRDLKLH